MLTYLFTSFVLMGVLAAGVSTLVYCALRRPVAFVALLLAVWIVTVALRDSISLTLSLAELRISAMDVLAFVMATTAFARFALHGVRSAAGAFTLVLLLLLAIHVVRGIPEFGVEPAVNSARTTLYFIAAMAYAATVPVAWDRRVWKLLITAGIALAILAMPFWLTGGLGSADTSIIRNGELIATRPIVAAGALLILEAGVLALVLSWPSKRLAVYLALVSGVAVLLLQHRTVWAAALVMAIVGFFVWSARAGRRADRTVLAVVGVCLLLLPFAALGLSRTEPLVKSAQEVRRGDSTFAWRATGWRDLIASHDSAADMAVGAPAGTSFDRRIRGGIVDVSAHNGFVEAYVRFGIPGVLVLTALGLVLWFNRARVSEGSGIPTLAIGLLLLTQLAFSVGYSLDAVQGIISGILVSGCAFASARGGVRLDPPTQGVRRQRLSLQWQSP